MTWRKKVVLTSWWVAPTRSFRQGTFAYCSGALEFRGFAVASAATRRPYAVHAYIAPSKPLYPMSRQTPENCKCVAAKRYLLRCGMLTTSSQALDSTSSRASPASELAIVPASIWPQRVQKAPSK